LALLLLPLGMRVYFSP